MTDGVCEDLTVPEESRCIIMTPESIRVGKTDQAMFAALRFDELVKIKRVPESNMHEKAT